MAKQSGAEGRGSATRPPATTGTSTARKKATEIAEGSPAAAARMRVRKAPPPHRCRQDARKWFAEELPAIFETFAKGAKAGDAVCLKALLTLSGFDKEETHAPLARRRGRSLKSILLGELRRNPPVRSAPEDEAGGCGGSSGAVGTGAAN